LNLVIFRTEFGVKPPFCANARMKKSSAVLAKSKLLISGKHVGEMEPQTTQKVTRNDPKA
jgi:hypothetical protein